MHLESVLVKPPSQRLEEYRHRDRLAVRSPGISQHQGLTRPVTAFIIWYRPQHNRLAARANVRILFWLEKHLRYG